MTRILLIEAQPQMRGNLCEMLELEGYAVLAAENGAIGLSLAQSELPDLILCDIMLPELDGPEPLETLGLTPREAEVLFWLAQGKSNGDIGAILDASPATVKKHTVNIFDKLKVENRGAATLMALEVLSGVYR